MSSTVICQKPAFEYFKSATQQPRPNTTVDPTFSWDSSPYTDPAIFSDDSLLTSPTTPESVIIPEYSFPKREHKPVIKTEEAFDFGSFEDWMRWDEPTDAALSPTSEFFPELKTEPLSPNMNRLELQGSGIGSNNNRINTLRTAEDSVVFIEDPVSEEPLFQTSNTLNMADIPPREGLYSTPLSWSRPTFGQVQSYNTILSPQEELKLRDIAMPPSARKAESYPASPASESSPEPVENNRKKRKPSMDEDDDDDDMPQSNGRHPPVKKTAHNMIEKRYRTNLNDKIAALRDSVPSLRVISKAKSRNDDTEEDLQGLTPAHKLNKATVLSKATEYIAHLEKRNKYLARENAALKSRVDAFEILVMARQPQQAQQQQQQQQQQHAQQHRNSMSMARQGSQSWMN